MRAPSIVAALVALSHPLYAEDAPQPVAPATAPSGAAAPTNPAANRTPFATQRIVFVPSGIDRMINFIADLYPDCSSKGSIEQRVVAKPQHGTAAFDQGDGFSNYPIRSLNEHCNTQKVQGLQTHYTSQDGYTGDDDFEVLYLMPDGSALQVKYMVLVK